MKPIVGVMPLWDEEKDRLWMLPAYLDRVCRAGGIPLLFPFLSEKEEVKRMADLCDGFLFTGGQDVSPSVYGEEAPEGLVSCCGKRDLMETQVLDEALRTGKPVLGICRGLQLINAALGGTLYQDLPLQRPSGVEHNQEKPYEKPVHSVSIVKGSPLYECTGEEVLSVNSCHHQAARAVAPGLEVMAEAPDGLIEALWMPGHPFLWAVQWHPEMLDEEDAASRMIFDAFIKAAGAEGRE